MRTSVISRSEVPEIFGRLGEMGYTTVGPTVRDGAIVYDELDGVDDLPIGWTDVQDPGGYRLERRDDDALFGFAVPADSWKKYLYPPRSDLLHIRSVDDSFVFLEPELPETNLALFGVRACELAAIAIQDKVFLDSGHIDRTYQNNRRRAFLIATNCATSSSSCFCASMGTGPAVESGYDLAITELIGPDRHDFLLEAGSAEGSALMESLPGREAGAHDFDAQRLIVAETEAAQTRTMPDADLQTALPALFDSPRWSEIADRCLGCTNCTLVCPTCFCSTVEDTSALDGTAATRSRRWDSCFTMDFSSVHGAPIRASTASRYRQWLTHKFATWHDQFGSSGCVGCGRCITWCPVGIDITTEVRALLSQEVAS